MTDVDQAVMIIIVMLLVFYIVGRIWLAAAEHRLSSSRAGRSSALAVRRPSAVARPGARAASVAGSKILGPKLAAPVYRPEGSLAELFGLLFDWLRPARRPVEWRMPSRTRPALFRWTKPQQTKAVEGEPVSVVEQYIVDPPPPWADSDAVLTARPLTVVDAIHHAYWDAEAEGRDPVAAAGQVLTDHFAVQNALRRVGQATGKQQAAGAGQASQQRQAGQHELQQGGAARPVIEARAERGRLTRWSL